MRINAYQLVSVACLASVYKSGIRGYKLAPNVYGMAHECKF